VLVAAGRDLLLGGDTPGPGREVGLRGREQVVQGGLGRTFADERGELGPQQLVAVENGGLWRTDRPDDRDGAAVHRRCGLGGRGHGGGEEPGRRERGHDSVAEDHVRSIHEYEHQPCE
jgi:hypothetical protein